MNFAREYLVFPENYYFTYSRETAVVREVGETPNDRNDRGMGSKVLQTYRMLTRSPSHPCWDRLVQHAHFPYTSTDPRAATTKTADSCTFDRRCRESTESRER